MDPAGLKWLAKKEMERVKDEFAKNIKQQSTSSYLIKLDGMSYVHVRHASLNNFTAHNKLQLGR